MDFVLAKELSEHSYILSCRKAFFYRFCDTGFKNRWCGLWAMPYKFLDYFAFKVNDEWLSPKDCISFGYNETSSSHQFELSGLSVKEFLFLPEDAKGLICLLTLKNISSEQKKVELSLETAVNIREREENWHERTYDARILENKVVVNSLKGSLVLGSFPLGKFNLTQQYKDHYPSGERQRCFIPCKYSIDLMLGPSSKNVFFIFSCGNDESEALLNYESMLKSLVSSYVEKEKKYSELISNSKIESSIEYVDQLFRWGVISLEKLVFDSDFGSGYFAGYPWFTQFWGRDSGWILPAVIDYGNFEDAKKAIKTLARFQKGCVPNTIYMNNKADYNSIDATLLWIIALYHYVKNSADILFLEEMKNNLIKALEWCEEREKNGFLEVGSKQTWMDTLDRKGKPIEIQVFWIEALKCLGSLFGLLGDVSKGKKLKEKARKIRGKFEREFWSKEDEFYFDRINGKDRTKTINPIFALFFGLTQNSEKILEKIENEFSSPFGVRTISKNESIYNPRGYHTGGAWGWLTALAACVEFKNNRPEKGLEHLKILSDRMNQNCIGAIDEAWNSEDDSKILLKENFEEEGACLQGWSSALVIRAIDECMLGMKIDALNKKIMVSPSLLNGMKIMRRKRVGNDFVDLLFERKGKKLSTSYKSRDGKEYKIIRVPKL